VSNYLTSRHAVQPSRGLIVPPPFPGDLTALLSCCYSLTSRCAAGSLARCVLVSLSPLPYRLIISLLFFALPDCFITKGPTALKPQRPTVRVPQCLTVASIVPMLPPSCFTVPLPHCPTASLSHYLTVPLPHYPTGSQSHCLTVPLPHSPNTSLSHCLPVPLPHHPTASPSHCLTIPLPHCPTASLSH
jgi:hypothetical protein